jgi:beta-mannanase
VGRPWDHDFNYWQSMFESVRARGELSLVDMNSGSVPLRDIANGLYDSSFTSWAQQAKAYGHPFFVRWDWEMNGKWFAWGTTSTNQNTPADYVAAWRHIHDLFAQAGATNVTWVWCVNHEFTGSVPLEQLYPGDGYVDWTSIDGYNQTAGWWQTFSNIFASTYTHLLTLAPAKPIMVAETSSIETSGSKASWITDALSTQLPQNFPQIKALVWMNWRLYQNGTWWDWEIESSASSQAAFKTAISAGYYAPGGSYGSLPLLTKITPPS